MVFVFSQCGAVKFVPIFQVNFLFLHDGGLNGVHHEAEKRNQFSFVCIFLVLDRNW